MGHGGGEEFPYNDQAGPPRGTARGGDPYPAVHGPGRAGPGRPDKPVDHTAGQRRLIAVFIRRVRKHARLSQTDLAELLGVTQSSVGQWERAIATPDGAHLLDFLLKLAPVSMTVLADLAERHAASTTHPAEPPPHPDSP